MDKHMTGFISFMAPGQKKPADRGSAGSKKLFFD